MVSHARLEEEMTAIDWTMIGVCCSFMLVDTIVGVLNACMHGQFKSGAMREGLWHKCSVLIVLMVAGLCDFVTGNGLVSIELPLSIVDVFGCMVVMMEIGSILENCLKMNPSLAPLGLFKIFGINEADSDTMNEDSSE